MTDPTPYQRAGQASGRARRRQAIQAYARLVPLIRRLHSCGESLAAIASQLNAQGYRTRTGARWAAMSVWRVLDRAGPGRIQ
jgi:hypothetical protein